MQNRANRQLELPDHSNFPPPEPVASSAGISTDDPVDHGEDPRRIFRARLMALTPANSARSAENATNASSFCFHVPPTESIFAYETVALLAAFARWQARNPITDLAMGSSVHTEPSTVIDCLQRERSFRVTDGGA